jgi:cytidylate kinase
LADRLGYIYIDTGAMYRAVTYVALQQQIAIDEEEKLARIAAEITFKFIPSGTGRQLVFCNAIDITEEIRDPLVSQKVSTVSSHREVRRTLVKKQQELAENNNVVMDGRDIGTVVLPKAEYKIFLTASLEERAQRRYKELLEKGYTATYDNIRDEMAKRDELDSSRAVDPLRPAPDAVIIDTTGISLEEVIQRIIKIYSEKRGEQ